MALCMDQTARLELENHWGGGLTGQSYMASMLPWLLKIFKSFLAIGKNQELKLWTLWPTLCHIFYPDRIHHVFVNFERRP